MPTSHIRIIKGTIPDQLHQSAVWAFIGVPGAYVAHSSDMYFTENNYVVIYYDADGWSQLVLCLPL